MNYTKVSNSLSELVIFGFGRIHWHLNKNTSNGFYYPSLPESTKNLGKGLQTSFNVRLYVHQRSSYHFLSLRFILSNQTVTLSCTLNSQYTCKAVKLQNPGQSLPFFSRLHLLSSWLDEVVPVLRSSEQRTSCSSSLSKLFALCLSLGEWTSVWKSTLSSSCLSGRERVVVHFQLSMGVKHLKDHLHLTTLHRCERLSLDSFQSVWWIFPFNFWCFGTRLEFSECSMLCPSLFGICWYGCF